MEILNKIVELFQLPFLNPAVGGGGNVFIAKDRGCSTD
jgi:hypothetical protein